MIANGGGIVDRQAIGQRAAWAIPAAGAILAAGANLAAYAGRARGGALAKSAAVGVAPTVRLFSAPLFAASFLAESFLAERERWPLWLPVAIGSGVGLYFALLTEPPWWLGAVWSLCALALAWFGRRRSSLLLLAGLATAMGAGFLLAQVRTFQVAAPVLQERLGPTMVGGRLSAVEVRGKGQRLVFEQPWVTGLPADRTPVRLRVTTRSVSPNLRPGDWVSVRAVLLPPMSPLAPRGFDFARQAYFQRLGAVGFAYGSARPAAAPAHAAREESRLQAANLALQRLRHDLTQRIFTALPGAVGGVAAALTTGERSGVPEEVSEAMRDAGLAHLLAISGLHLSLAAGCMFFATRLAIALIEPLALRVNGKKWAATTALVGAGGYLLLSGAAVPAQRAFVMTGVVLLAILLDRRALSMYLVAWAAVAVLIRQPEALFQPGFQMSFAAVVALIAAYEAFGARFAAWHGRAGLGGRILLHLATVGFTSVVAGLATEPFSLYHFHRFITFGLVGNLLAVPTTAFWVMPWAIVAFVLMPFGLEAVGLAPMGLGIRAVMAVAHWVAGFPGDVVLVRQMPTAGLILIAFGGLWLCLWRRGWRFLGLAPIAIGLATAALAPRPEILVDGDARLLAVRMDDGRLALSPGRGGKMVKRVWLERDGAAAPAVWPEKGAGGAGPLQCDELGCRYHWGGHLVALVWSAAALVEDCAEAEIVVSLVPVHGSCGGARRVIDRSDLRRDGAYALYLGDKDDVRVESVGETGGARPWTRPRPPPRRDRP